MKLCAIAFLALLATIGCSRSRSEGSCLSVTSFGPRNLDAAGVDALDAAWGSNTKTTDVHGEAVNNCGSVIGDAFVEFTLHDAEGAQIGTAIASTHNLAPEGTWKFNASLAGVKARSIRLARVSALR